MSGTHREHEATGSEERRVGKMLAGWRAPADTFVLFDPSWPYGPNSPESIQAVSRVSGLANI
jgi:hypothetical protein